MVPRGECPKVCFIRSSCCSCVYLLSSVSEVSEASSRLDAAASSRITCLFCVCFDCVISVCRWLTSWQRRRWCCGIVRLRSYIHIRLIIIQDILVRKYYIQLSEWYKYSSINAVRHTSSSSESYCRKSSSDPSRYLLGRPVYFTCLSLRTCPFRILISRSAITLR